MSTEPTTTPIKRQCASCFAKKPLTNDYFSKRTYASGLSVFRKQCHVCRNKKAKIPRPEAGRQPTKICWICCGLSHRVPAIRCPGCGLRHKAEEPPKVELFARNFDRAM